MGCWEQGTGFGKPGFVDFVGEESAVPAQGYCVDLNTRIYLDQHQLGSVMDGKLESGKEGTLTVGCTLSKQGTFKLVHGYITCGVLH